MRVLITGAAGFVGGYLIQHLRESDPGVEIVGIVHPGQPFEVPAEPIIQFVPCDIVANGGADIAALIRRERPDRLYHLAGAASGAAVDRDAVFQVNVDGTRYVVEAARDIVAPEHVLFASTGYVYGPCDPARPARESDPLPPLDRYGVYAESKRAAEEVALPHAVVARAFNHTGPGQTAAFAVPAFASQVVEIERGQLSGLRVGNLEARRDFLDVRDVVRAYRLLCEQGTAGEVYNVCSGHAQRMRDVLDELIALARCPVTVTTDPARMRLADIAASVGSHTRLSELTGWEPQIPWSRTLEETLDWWRGR